MCWQSGSKFNISAPPLRASSPGSWFARLAFRHIRGMFCQINRYRHTNPFRCPQVLMHDAYCMRALQVLEEEGGEGEEGANMIKPSYLLSAGLLQQV